MENDSRSSLAEVVVEKKTSQNESRPSLAEVVVLVEKKTSQNPTPIPTQPSRWSRLVADSWAIELLAGTVSFAAIASIIGVLWGYDQKPVPALWKGITVGLCLSLIYPHAQSKERWAG
jgi:hypothetical protein